MQSSASQTKRALHLADGPQQVERDRKIQEASLGRGTNPDLWADRTFQQYIWGTDVMYDTIVKWPEWKARVDEKHIDDLATAVLA